MCWLLLLGFIAAVIWGWRNKSKVTDLLDKIQGLQIILANANSNLEFVQAENKTLSTKLTVAYSIMDTQARRIAELERKLEGSQSRPAASGSLEDSEAAKKNGRMPFFTIFTDEGGQFRWNFKAKNNKIVADSAESYTTKQNVEKGLNTLINSIKEDDYKIKIND
jgi:uncharacterized protein YegP (UPF0339 family)